ncbi:MAG: S8 family serine peptidase [Caldilineae bacterium]|nr:S8 family serine peptidase [Caldilineae bacterium]
MTFSDRRSSASTRPVALATGCVLTLVLLLGAAGRPAGAVPIEPPLAGSGPAFRADLAAAARIDPIDPARNAPEPGAPLRVDGAVTDAIAAEGWAEVLIGLADGVPDTAPLDSLARAAAEASAQLLASLGPEDFQLHKTYSHLPIVAGSVSASGLEKLRRNPRVTAIDDDVWVYPLVAPAAALAAPLGLVESLPSIGADKVHAMGIKGEGIGVAVLDTGIDNSHPDFENAIVDQYCFSSGTNSCVSESGRGVAKGPNAQDEQGHGTGVSGIVLGRGKVAPVGVAPEANLIAVRVFRDTGGAPTNDIVDGLNFVVANQAKHNIRAANMSLGGGAALGTNCDNQYGSVKQVFQTLLARNVAIFVATGNGGNPDRVAFPGCISNGTGVGSTFDADLEAARMGGGLVGCLGGKAMVSRLDIACYTDRGRAMDIVAPGSYIVTARLGGGSSGSGPYGGGHGTSYASPTAAGVAALIFSADPKIHARDIERLLQQTGEIVIHPESGAEIKRVNAYNAVLAVLPATPTAEHTPTSAPSATPQPPTITATAETPPTDAPTQAPEPSETPEPSRTPARTATATEAPGAAVFLPLLRKGQAP